MKVYRFLTTAAIVLFSASAIIAQPAHRETPDPKTQADRMTQRMTEQLDLSKKQAKQIHEILFTHFEQRKANRENTTENRSNNRTTAFESHRTEMNNAIQKILTKEQYQKWSEQRAKMKQHKNGARRGSAPAPQQK